MRVIDRSMEQRWNGRGETEYPRENTPTNDVVWHDSHMPKTGMTRLGIELGSPCVPMFDVPFRTFSHPPNVKPLTNFILRRVLGVICIEGILLALEREIKETDPANDVLSGKGRRTKTAAHEKKMGDGVLFSRIAGHSHNGALENITNEQCNEKTARQYRDLRLAAMAHFIRVAVSLLLLPCFSASNVRNSRCKAGHTTLVRNMERQYACAVMADMHIVYAVLSPITAFTHSSQTVFVRPALHDRLHTWQATKSSLTNIFRCLEHFSTETVTSRKLGVTGGGSNKGWVVTVDVVRIVPNRSQHCVHQTTCREVRQLVQERHRRTTQNTFATCNYLVSVKMRNPKRETDREKATVESLTQAAQAASRGQSVRQTASRGQSVRCETSCFKRTACALLSYVPENLKSRCPTQTWVDKQQVRHDWFSGLLKSHTTLAIRTAEAISLSRASYFDKVNVKGFFDKLGELYNRYHFGLSDIYNTDKTGVASVYESVKRVARKGFKQPMVVFPRVRNHDHFIRDGPLDCAGAGSRSGWMTEVEFLMFMKHFVHSVRSSKERPVLLLDNHQSHLLPNILDYAKNIGVVMLSFLPHCTHLLQPLDRSVYGPLKKHINTAMDGWICSRHSQRFSAEMEGQQTTVRSITIYDILAIKCGIFPFNSKIFTDADFGPLFFTDTPNPAASIAANVSSLPNPVTNNLVDEYSVRNPASTTSANGSYLPNPVTNTLVDESSMPNTASSTSANVFSLHNPVMNTLVDEYSVPNPVSSTSVNVSSLPNPVDESSVQNPASSTSANVFSLPNKVKNTLVDESSVLNPVSSSSVNMHYLPNQVTNTSVDESSMPNPVVSISVNVSSLPNTAKNTSIHKTSMPTPTANISADSSVVDSNPKRFSLSLNSDREKNACETTHVANSNESAKSRASPPAALSKTPVSDVTSKDHFHLNQCYHFLNRGQEKQQRRKPNMRSSGYKA
ncbi:hypothetical protein PR048_018270 [Dryococelus australis]|uniref:DDE-1 domain-containing protein n=1 Tax=Dryococelus australis TaxID=614101 RepID=A0ABQ9HC05_9NEOP|nr:hypothetical protein PR048_018270 [Dryococelus australis]